MNFFLTGFFNQIQNFPAAFLNQIEHDDTVSFSSAIATILLKMATVEAVLLVVFLVVFADCRLGLDSTDFLWFEENGQKDKNSESWVKRSRRIQEAIEEKRYEMLGPDRPSCCPICLNNYESNDVVAGSSKRCRHIFHKSCLERWLRNQSSCPYCRQELLNLPKQKCSHPFEPTTTSSSMTH